MILRKIRFFLWLISSKKTKRLWLAHAYAVISIWIAAIAVWSNEFRLFSCFSRILSGYVLIWLSFWILSTWLLALIISQKIIQKKSANYWKSSRNSVNIGEIVLIGFLNKKWLKKINLTRYKLALFAEGIGLLVLPFKLYSALKVEEALFVTEGGGGGSGIRDDCAAETEETGIVPVDSFGV